MALPPLPHGKRLLPYKNTETNIGYRQTTKRSRRDLEGAELGSLPEDVVFNVTSFLDARSLLSVRSLNRQFRTLASQGSAGWGDLCEKLWKTKVHVVQAARENPDSMAAYRISVLDASDRAYVTEEELLFDPVTNTGTIWDFRFKESAGPDWTAWDPWYNGGACRKMVFLGDGSVKEYCPDETNPNQTTTRNPQFTREGTLVDTPVPMTWRFLTTPLDFPALPRGSYIRFSVGGRDVPTYCIRRSPTKNWGFVMESCWGIYASFRLPLRPSTSMRLRRAQDDNGNWFNLEIQETDSDAEEESEESAMLSNDDSFGITIGLQWKEAFLHNHGARVLPEGEDAVAEFNRTYGSILRT